jgi:hypothetical protein
MSAVGDFIGGITGSNMSDAYGEAGDVQSQSYQDALRKLQNQFGQTQAQFNPFIKGGTQAFREQLRLSGALGAQKQQNAFGRFTQSPGQQFLQQQAEKALLRNAAATGNLGGGRTQQALQQQAIGLGQQDFQNYLGNLGGISSMGLNAAGNLGQLSGQFGSNMANLTTGLGQSQAGTILGQAQAKQQGMENILGLGSMALGAFGMPSFGSSAVGGTTNIMAGM